MDNNSMDIDIPQDDKNIINNTSENVDNAIISETDNGQKKTEDEFDDDNMDLNADDINFLMSPQPEKSSNLSIENSKSTNLDFNSISNSNSNSNLFSTQSSLSQTKSYNSTNSRNKDEEIMKLETYYKNFFPFNQYYHWLSYGNVDKKYFSHREFSFTLKNDVYIRFQSFNDENEFKNELLKLTPRKIDIGAVYNIKPNERRKIAGAPFTPQEKELIFDIDMTDYDDIRTCCSGGDICKKCWTFMTIAIKIIHRALTEDFGFEHILWIYSGRRGVHCWVCDERARKLNEPSRKAIVSYLEVVKGGEQQSKKVNLPSMPTLHPSLKHSEEIVRKYFKSLILDDMNIMNNEKEYKKLLNMTMDEEIMETMKDSWKSNKSPEYKWDELMQKIEKKEKKKNDLKFFERDAIFQYTYPRLDSNVSLSLNHLLKSPFCIHPGTGRVCVPISPEYCEDFDPFSVPTIDGLIKEMEELKSNGSPEKINYRKSTSIAKYIKQFSSFLKYIDETEIHQARKIKREEMEQDMDF